MKTDIIFLTGDYPSIAGDDDPNGIYFYDVARCLCEEAGKRIQVAAFRIGGKEYFEEKNGLSVTRFDLPRDGGSADGRLTSDVELMYSHRMYAKAVSALALHAVRMAEAFGKDTPVWCHGIETSGAAIELRKRGFPVVSVAHYLIAQELMNRLEAYDDPKRAGYFARTVSYYAGALIPRRHRPGLLRFLSHTAPVLSLLPLPDALELLGKLVSEAQLIRASNLVTAVSPGLAESIAELHPASRNKLRVSVAGAPAPSVGSHWPFPVRDDRLRLLMVGRPVPNKGWDYVARALKNLELVRPAEAGRIEITLIGNAEKSGGAYGRLIDETFKSLKSVSYFSMEWLPNKRVLEIMSAADALILPSVFETFGLVILEAMANGCMILASDADGPRSVVKTPWGIIANFQDPESRAREIERGILKLLSLSREEINALGEEARAASRQYTWKKCADAHAAVLEEARLFVSGVG